MTETERLIDGLAAKTNSEDRANLIGLIRRRAIEATIYQFKEGLELSDMGAVMPPETIIDLIANYSGSDQSVTW